MIDAIRSVANVFKLRIGVSITLCAVAGAAVVPGAGPGAGRLALLALAVFLSSAAAGAFNQYAERDLDARMPRTRTRPFVVGTFRPGWLWPTSIVALLALAVVLAAAVANAWAALYVFLGAFTYGVVYTLWLKRRTSLNIVVGGAAGSFALLAGAAAVAPQLNENAIILAIVLFLWTPPHFWSLSFVFREQYANAGVPMLPVVVSPKVAAWVIFIHVVLLVSLSLLPVHYGLGWPYLAGALLGGVHFLRASWRLVQTPSRDTARSAFHSSLLQLTLLLGGAIVDGLMGSPWT
jgi:protoheme IX farnesyltransferase